VQELQPGRSGPQQVAIAATQGGAADHGAPVAVRRKPFSDGFKPRRAVVVVKRLTGGHLGDARLAVERVGIGILDPQAVSQRVSDRRFA